MQCKSHQALQYYLNCEISARDTSKIVECLVDTGAAVSLVKKGFVTNDGKLTTNMKLFTVTGDNIPNLSCVKLSCDLHGQKFDHVFIEADIHDNIVLGADVLTELGAVINMKEHTIDW